MQPAWYLITGIVVGGLLVYLFYRSRLDEVEDELEEAKKKARETPKKAP